MISLYGKGRKKHLKQGKQILFFSFSSCFNHYLIVKSRAAEVNEIFKFHQKTFPFPRQVFSVQLKLPAMESSVITAKLSLKRSIERLIKMPTLKPDINANLSITTKMPPRGLKTLDHKERIKMNHTRLVMNRFRALDNLKKRKLRSNNHLLMAKFSMDNMLESLRKGKKLPTGEDLWRACLNSTHIKVITDPNSKIAYFSHKSANRSLENYNHYFSMSKRSLKKFYLCFYDSLIEFALKNVELI